IDAGADVRPDTARPTTDAGESTTPGDDPPGTLCTTNADCEVAGGSPLFVCSTEFFAIGDVYGDPVCVAPCMRGAGSSWNDILCAGDLQHGARGVCDAPAPGAAGTCLPLCELSPTKIDT